MVLHLVAACVYAGFQLTVRLVVYPQMAGVPASASAGYEAGHRRRITPLVGVLFAALAASTLLLILDGGIPRAAAWGAAALYAGLLAVTAFGAVPQHEVLSRGFDPRAHARLLRWDAVRVLLALAQLALGTWLVLRPQA